MKTAVILHSLGGPASLDAVFSFLFAMFSDKAIIPLPFGLRHLVAFMIAARRKKSAQEIYRLMGGKSPLLKNTQAQAKALYQVLGPDFKIFVAMRYADPSAPSVSQQVAAYNPNLVFHLPLYPQYSDATTGSSLSYFRTFLNKTNWRGPTETVPSFQTAPFFINSFAADTLPLINAASVYGRPVVLLSAHGLPEKFIERGDPYQTQCEETAAALSEKLSNEDCDFILSYQSRVGPMKWIGPETSTEIEKAAAQNRPIVVVPIAFVCEHSETTVELGIDYKQLAEKHGAPFYAVAKTPGTSSTFIFGLAAEVRKAVQTIIDQQTENSNNAL